MEFPKLPYNMNRNRKIMDYEDAVIKKLYAEGKTLEYLANMFGVSRETIRKHVDEEYRKKAVAASVKAHQAWYRSLSKEEKKGLWRYAHLDLKDNAKRYAPQQNYIDTLVENNHRKPENHKKRLEYQNKLDKEYRSNPEINNKILQRARDAYKEKPELRAYHKQYDKDFKATHKLTNGKWILVDGLKWRILREMVIRDYNR